MGRMKKVLARSKYILLLAAGIQTYAIIGINWAYKLGVTSSATAIYLGMSIITIWAGILFLKERDHLRRKVISSAIVTAGIIIIKVFT